MNRDLNQYVYLLFNWLPGSLFKPMHMLFGSTLLLFILIPCTIAYILDRVDYYTGREGLSDRTKLFTAIVIFFGWPLFYYLIHR